MTTEAMWPLEPELGYLIHEHLELRHRVDRLPRLAEAVGGPVRRDVAHVLDPVIGWLRRELEPHLAWEGSVFHPEVVRMLATPSMAEADAAERKRVGDLATRLCELIPTAGPDATRETGVELEALLLELHGLVMTHVEREARLIASLQAPSRQRHLARAGCTALTTRREEGERLPAVRP
jgi:hypothetical protein